MKLWILLAIVCTSQAVSFFNVVVEEWEVWKLTHGKNYTSPTEEKFRMKIFMENHAMISKHNNRALQGHHTYFLKMNHYGDMLHHEFASVMNGYRSDLKNSNLVGATYIAPAHVTLPEAVDWRTNGAVTPIKDQGQCGSCWSFSTTGALEGQNFRKTGKLVSLSEQNLIDCSGSYGNNGCDGGLMDNAFKYIKDNGGIDTEESYPYEAEDDHCRYTKKNKGASDIGFTDIPAGNETALQAAIATVGPVAVAIDAGHQSFQFYSHGVYTESDCDPQSLDHGVLAVGYGVDQDSGKKYWLVKNSWGTVWGDKGFIKMARDENNMCGIASSASYPLV